MKLPIGHYIDIRTYKRNRYLLIIKLDNNTIRIIENGYSQMEYKIEKDKFHKLMKMLIKKEFPRSNKIRLYMMGEYIESKALRVGRKIL